MGAIEIDVFNADLGCLGDLEGYGSAATAFIDARHVMHVGLWVARFLVELLDFLSIGKELMFIERIADFGGQFLFEL